MRGGTAIYCPLCKSRQTVGQPGERFELPTQVVCDSCGTPLTLEKSESGGIHVTAAGGAVAR